MLRRKTNRIWMFITQDTIYLPTLGRSFDGPHYEVEPVLTSELAVDGLAAALEQLVRRGHPWLWPRSRLDLRGPSPAEKAMRIRGRKRMARKGVIIAVLDWRREGIALAFSFRDDDSLDYIDYAHEQLLQRDTPMRAIAELILQEVAGRRGVEPSEDERG